MGRTVAEQTAAVAASIRDDRDEIVELCLAMGNMPSPAGDEIAVARYVADWLQRNDFDAFIQPITERSANAIGRLHGTGEGPSLIFNAHIDTGRPLPADAPERIRRIHGAWVEGDTIFGLGVVNCKAQVIAGMIAARAIKRAGIRLKGDLLVTAVTYETGSASVDEEQGIEFPGEGFGTQWMVNAGITADYALVGETSDFNIVKAECGAVRLRISVPGREIHTPRLRRGKTIQDNPNSIVKMAHLIEALEEWAVAYEQRETKSFDGGTFVPKAQVKKVHSSISDTYVHMDIRLVPGANPRRIEQEVRGVISGLGLACDVRPYYWRRGYIAEGAEALIQAVESAHQSVHGRPTGTPKPEDVSMWRDLNVFNEVGIPSINYGPPRQRETYSDARNRCMFISDIVLNAEVYARTAIALCGISESTTPD